MYVYYTFKCNFKRKIFQRLELKTGINRTKHRICSSFLSHVSYDVRNEIYFHYFYGVISTFLIWFFGIEQLKLYFQVFPLEWIKEIVQIVANNSSNQTIQKLLTRLKKQYLDLYCSKIGHHRNLWNNTI